RPDLETVPATKDAPSLDLEHDVRGRERRRSEIPLIEMHAPARDAAPRSRPDRDASLELATVPEVEVEREFGLETNPNAAVREQGELHRRAHSVDRPA